MSTGEWHTSDVYAEHCTKSKRPPEHIFMANLFERAMVDVESGIPLEDARAYLRRIGQRALGSNIAIEVQTPTETKT